MKELEIVWE